MTRSTSTGSRVAPIPGPGGPSREKLLEIFGARDQEAAKVALERVLERYEGGPDRGIRVEEVAGGLRLVTRPDLHGYLRKFFEVSGRTRLSMAALETLAIVAYRQPITGPEIQELRGVSPSGVFQLAPSTFFHRRPMRTMPAPSFSA